LSGHARDHHGNQRSDGTVVDLDNRLLNVPATFVVPSNRPLAVGSSSQTFTAGSGATAQLNAPGGSTSGVQVISGDVNITIQDARDPEATAQAVARVLRDQTRRGGAYISSRA